MIFLCILFETLPSTLSTPHGKTETGSRLGEYHERATEKCKREKDINVPNLIL